MTRWPETEVSTQQGGRQGGGTPYARSQHSGRQCLRDVRLAFLGILVEWPECTRLVLRANYLNELVLETGCRGQSAASGLFYHGNQLKFS